MPPIADSLQNRWSQADWPGFDFIFFDCDSTLSTIEGIDELARKKGRFAEVKRMTDAAMDGEVHLQSVYDHRLQLLAPTRAEIRELEQHYRQTMVPHAAEVIAALQHLGKEPFIISGGLLGAVRPFGEWLGIPAENIRAVDVRYNRLSGAWWDYQQDRWGHRPDETYLDSEDTPLIESHGKADVVAEFLRHRAGRSLLVGDGMSDVAARSAVDLLVGFGGVVVRQGVLRAADIFIHCPSLAPVLALALSPAERDQLQNTPFQSVLQAGLACMAGGDVTFNR